MLKKSLVLVLTLLFILSLSLSAAAAGAGVSVRLNGSQLSQSGYAENGIVYLPLREVCENLGYQVEWPVNNGGSLAIVAKGRTVIIDLKNDTVTDNGHSYYIIANGDACFFRDGRAYADAGLLGRLLDLNRSYDGAAGLAVLQTAALNPISISTRQIKNDNGVLITDIQYPLIGGLDNIKAEQAINGVIMAAVAKAQNEGLANDRDMREYLKLGYSGGVRTCETYFNYQVEYNQNGLLSLVFYDYQYAGGAHGLTVQSSYTFDLETGAILSLDGLMQSGSDYLAYINGAVRAEIDRRVGAGLLSEFEDSPFTAIAPGQDYYLSADGLVIYFQEYQYFPYAAGIQEFSLPYSGLAERLKSDYSYLWQAAGPEALPARSITLAVGESAKISLAGNPTTGYSWQYQIKDDDIIAFSAVNYEADSSLIGAGGKYSWEFKALKAGTAKIVFKYYRSWEGEDSAIDTVEYLVTVKQP